MTGPGARALGHAGLRTPDLDGARAQTPAGSDHVISVLDSKLFLVYCEA